MSTIPPLEPTPNLHLQLIEANRLTWADIMNTNLKLIDAAIGAYYTVYDLQGIWQNSTAYVAGQSVIDFEASVMFLCLVSHTSAMVPTTFEEERLAHPEYWSPFISSGGTSDLPFIDVRAFAPSAVVDSRTALQTAINYAAALRLPLDLVGGTWRSDNFLTLPSNLVMRNGTLDFTQCPGLAAVANNYMLRAYGAVTATVSAITDLLADGIAPTGQQITLAPGGVAALGGVVSDDMIYISCNRPWQGTTLVGELQTVHSVPSTDVIRVSAPALYNYTAAEATKVQKITPARNIRMEDVVVLGPGYPEGQHAGGISFSYARDCHLRRVTFKDFNLVAVRFAFWYACSIKESVIRNAPNRYGIATTHAGRDLLVDGNNIVNTRHAFTSSSSVTPHAGSSGTAGNGVPNMITISNNYVEGREAAIDCHPGADNVMILNNHIVCKGDPSESANGLDNHAHGIFYQGQNLIANGNFITGNVMSGIFHQVATAQAGNPPASSTMIGNQVETTNTFDATGGVYCVQNIAGAVGYERVHIDSQAQGPFGFGVRIVTVSDALFSNIKISGNYNGMLLGGIQLRPQVGSMTDVAISNVTFTSGDPLVAYGVQLHPSLNTTLTCRIDGLIARNVLAAVQRNGQPNGALTLYDANVSTDGPLFTGFGTPDRYRINGYGLFISTEAVRVLTTGESGMSFTNTGATAQVQFTLPTAARGLWYQFFCTDVDGLRVVASTGDVIRMGTSVSTSAGFINSIVIGSTISLYSVDAVSWYAVGVSGTWTIG